MATTRNQDSSTMPSMNRNCLAEECESSGEYSNDISFTEDCGESSTYLSPNSYRQMLSLCDIATGISHHSPLPLRVQTLRIISQYVYDHGMSRELIDWHTYLQALAYPVTVPVRNRKSHQPNCYSLL